LAYTTLDRPFAVFFYKITRECINILFFLFLSPGLQIQGTAVFCIICTVFLSSKAKTNQKITNKCQCARVPG